MKKKDVQIGGVYLAMDALSQVLIVSKRGRTGWNARDLATGREVFIRSAAQLRERLDPVAVVLQHAADK